MKIVLPAHKTALSVAALFDVERHCTDGIFEERSFAIVHYKATAQPYDFLSAFHAARPVKHTIHDHETNAFQFQLSRAYHNLHDDLRSIIQSIPDISFVLYIIEDEFEYQYDAQICIPNFIFNIDHGHVSVYHKGNGLVGIHEINVIRGKSHPVLTRVCDCCLCQCS